MILPSLILIPLIGGLLCWQSERFGRHIPRWIAFCSMLAVAALAVKLWIDGGYGVQSIMEGRWKHEFHLEWIPRLGISFHLGLDGLSLLMILLTGGLGLAAVVCSWQEIQKFVGFFYLNLLWNLAGVIGVFLALDLFLFFFFWEMMLVPMYFLIALWGHQSEDAVKSRIYAANKFFIFTQASGLLLLVSILMLVFIHYHTTQVLTFNYDALLMTAPHIPQQWQMIIMLGFFIAFAVKLPVVPLHSWLPDAHAQAPTAGSVDLAGILLKTAAYGMLRFCLPLFPEACQQFAPVAMWLGIIGIFYGAFMACAQTDIKRLVAYTSVSHMGFVLIGIFAGTLISLQGTIIQMLAHGLSAGALFILCGEIYERLHTRDLRQMGGLWTRMAWLPAITLFFAAASLGMPGLGNFVGEFLILLGSYPQYPWIVMLAAGGLVFAVIYSLGMVHKAFYGQGRENTAIASLNARELVLVLTLAASLLALGLFPQAILDLSDLPLRFILLSYSQATG